MPVRSGAVAATFGMLSLPRRNPEKTAISTAVPPMAGAAFRQ